MSYLNTSNLRSLVTRKGNYIHKQPYIPQECFTELQVLRTLQGLDCVPTLHPDYLEGSQSDIVMEYILGSSLLEYTQALLKDKELSEDYASILQEVNNSLCQLESRGIIHCDLHLENVIIQPRGKGWKAYIIDFGWALQSSEPDPDWWKWDGDWLPDSLTKAREKLIYFLNKEDKQGKLTKLIQDILT
jgi:serine/threonine protein kinase